MSETTPQDQSAPAYRVLFNLLKQAIFVVSGETGLIHDANPAAEALTGWSLSEMRAMHHTQLHPSDEAERARQTFAELVRAPAVFRHAQPNREWNVLHRDGRRIPVDILAEVFAGSEKPLVFAIFRDITERRRSEEALRDSERKYRRLHESISDAVATVDMTGHIVECNPAFAALAGYSVEELRRMTYRDLTPERWHAFEEQILAEQVLTRGHSDVYEKEYCRRDGTVVPVELHTFLLTNVGGQGIGMWAIVRDITERKRAEDALRESAERYRTILEAALDGFTVVDTQGRLLEVNDAFCRMSGYTAEELQTMRIHDLDATETASDLTAHVQEIVAQGSDRFESKIRRKEGSLFDTEMSVHYQRSCGGQLVCFIRDVTERKRSEQVLRESERRFRSLFDNAFDGVFLTQTDGSITAANSVACAMFGMTEQEICTAGRDALIVNDERLREALETRRLTGRAQSETAFIRKDGSKREAEFASMVLDESGKAFVILRDITDRRRTEEALRISEEKFSTLFRLSPISITVSDLNDRDRFLEVNEAFERFTGHSRESVIGKTYPPDWLWVDAKEYANAVATFTATSQLNGFEFRFRRTSGEVQSGQLWARAIEFAGKACVVAMTIDITERKQDEADKERLQQQLAHAQRMESVGRLAGGIAHDFNNLMSVILMHTDSAMDELNNPDAAKESIAAIEDTAQKAVALGRQLMSFSQKQVLEAELLDLNAVIAENHKMIRRLIGEDVKVEFKPGPAMLVKADRGQLGQVIVNLAVNSRDAMPEGGTFEMQTCRVEIEDGDPRLTSGAKPGPYVELKVRDCGTGMDPETQARIFEPFFTTKGVGKGSGLGLAIVYGIISQMGGFISVHSEPGHGTEFTIHLPLASGASPLDSAGKKGPTMGGSETVLLVEDEPALRKKLQHVLAKTGYRVLAAADGGQAFYLFIENAGRIDLLLTDVVMPEIAGDRLAERLQILRPQLKVLFMSGYPDLGHGSVALRSQGNFIQKPFTKERLLRRLREIMDGRGEG